MSTRTVFIAVATAIAIGVGVLVGALALPGGSSASSASEEQLQRDADSWQINQLQQSFHEALAAKDIDLMMSLWAPNATFTLPGSTYVGMEQVREFFLTRSDLFLPETNWIADTASYKTRITVNGDRGTLYFECHLVNAATGAMEITTAADVDVTKIDGRWLFTSFAGAPTTLSP